MNRRKEIVFAVLAIMLVIGVFTIKYRADTRKQKAVELAKEYLAQKYEQDMVYSNVWLSPIDPGQYHVYFVAEKTGVKFEVIMWPSALDTQLGLINFEEDLWDNYKSSFFREKTSESLTPSIKGIWGETAYITVHLSSARSNKNTGSEIITEHMTVREMEPFYHYDVFITTNRQLNTEVKEEESLRILDLLKAIKEQNCWPVRILIWYQTEKKGDENEKYIVFSDGESPFQSRKLENWLEIDDVERIKEVMEEQWFSKQLG